MIRYLLILLISVISISYSQNNSSVYKNSSLIQLYSLDKELSDSLLKFNINPMSCRNSILESPIIVDDQTISWLKEKNISFSILDHNVEDMINNQMNRIKNIKKNRFSNWFSTYRELNEIDEYLNGVIEQSDIISKEVIGQSYEGRDISAFKISVDNGIENKTAILINGCQHAR